MRRILFVRSIDNKRFQMKNPNFSGAYQTVSSKNLEFYYKYPITYFGFVLFFSLLIVKCINITKNKFKLLMSGHSFFISHNKTNLFLNKRREKHTLRVFVFCQHSFVELRILKYRQIDGLSSIFTIGIQSIEISIFFSKKFFIFLIKKKNKFNINWNVFERLRFLLFIQHT